MPAPPWFGERGGRIELRVRIQPRASQDQIVGVVAGRLKIRIAAAPVDDAANRAVISLLAKAFRCPRSEVVIESGRSAKDKTIAITGYRARPAWLPRP